MKKLLGILVLGFLYSGNAYAGCIKGDCINGYGIYKFNNGDRIAMECYDFDESFQEDSNYPNPDSFLLVFNLIFFFSFHPIFSTFETTN